MSSYYTNAFTVAVYVQKKKFSKSKKTKQTVSNDYFIRPQDFWRPSKFVLRGVGNITRNRLWFTLKIDLTNKPLCQAEQGGRGERRPPTLRAPWPCGRWAEGRGAPAELRSHGSWTPELKKNIKNVFVNKALCESKQYVNGNFGPWRFDIFLSIVCCSCDHKAPANSKTFISGNVWEGLRQCHSDD